MCNKLIYLICFVLVLSLVVDVQAAEVYWDDAGTGHLWSTASNWVGDKAPGTSDWAHIDMLSGPIVANAGAVAQVLSIGRYGSGTLTVDGGTLTTGTGGWFALGFSAGYTGTLNMKSGTLAIGDSFNAGREDVGITNMTGGTITVGNTLLLGETAGGTAHLYLDGGIIDTQNFGMRVNAGAIGTMDITAGTLIIDGDVRTTIEDYIDSGWITGYGGSGEVLYDYSGGNTT